MRLVRGRGLFKNSQYLGVEWKIADGVYGKEFIIEGELFPVALTWLSVLFESRPATLINRPRREVSSSSRTLLQTAFNGQAVKLWK
jgi:hypothetical protein